MYNKIDKIILDKIVTFSNDENKIDVIIKYKNEFLNVIKSLKIKEYINLPFISSIACRVNYNDILKIALNQLVQNII